MTLTSSRDKLSNLPNQLLAPSQIEPLLEAINATILPPIQASLRNSEVPSEELKDSRGEELERFNLVCTLLDQNTQYVKDAIKAHGQRRGEYVETLTAESGFNIATAFERQQNAIKHVKIAIEANQDLLKKS